MYSKTLKSLLTSGCLAVAMIAAMPGCERQEEVLEVETPEGEFEVNRDTDSGEVDVDVTEEEDMIQP